MTTYERVTFRTGKGRRTVILQDVAEVTICGLPMLAGAQVDREGELVEPDADYLRAHGAVTGTRRFIVEIALITRRQPMAMNLTYGELCPARP